MRPYLRPVCAILRAEHLRYLLSVHAWITNGDFKIRSRLKIGNMTLAKLDCHMLELPTSVMAFDDSTGILAAEYLRSCKWVL